MSTEDRGSTAAEWADFTVASYSDLLDIAKTKYRFASYLERIEDRHVLWRHDIDFSVHRALRLAKIEYQKKIRATYFFMLRSSFYNLFEKQVLELARAILGMGHYAGLHFTAEGGGDLLALEAEAGREREILSYLLGMEISTVSFHNPTMVSISDRVEIAGMVNTYGRELMQHYAYCSDSNGYWRHRSLKDVLTKEVPDRLQVLTHPEWWTESPMPPRQRIERAVMGRASSVLKDYDETLAKSGRQNIR